MSLEQAIKESDSRVVEVLSSLCEQQRRELAPVALKWFKCWWSQYGTDHEGVPHAVLSKTVTLAVMGTASLSQIKKQKVLGSYDSDMACRLLRDRRPDWLQDWAEWFLEQVPTRWSFVRRLEKEGLIQRPETDFYILGMIVAAKRCTPLEFLREDPELLDEIPRLFEIEGAGENSLAAYDKYVTKNGWSEALRSLSSAGALSRDRLLDHSLRALSLDFAPFRASWHSRFHESLKPTLKERSERGEVYLDLLCSQVGPTQSFALKALEQVVKNSSLDDDRLSQAVENVWSTPTKSAALSALRLVDSLPPDRQPEHLRQALLHPHPDVIGCAFERLRKLHPEPDDTLRESLVTLTSEIPATLQPQWQSWLGECVPFEGTPTIDLGGPPQFDLLVPCETGDEVCGLAAQILEGSASPWDVERCLDGMLNHRGVFKKQEALKKRARQRIDSAHFTAPLAAVILTWSGIHTKLASTTEKEDLQGILRLRLQEINSLLKRSKNPTRLLSLPSRTDGFVIREELALRLDRAPEQPIDFAQLLLRLPEKPEEVQTPDKKVRQLLLTAFGLIDEKRWSWPFQRYPTICRRAAQEARFHRQGFSWDWNVRARQHIYEGKTYTHRRLEMRVPQKSLNWSERSQDTLFWRRWESTVCPVGRRRWLLRSIQSVANNLDWAEADWGDIVYLESLTDSVRPWSELEAILVSFGMACKEPGQFGLSVEQTARALQWGGLDARTLGKAMSRCAGTEMIKPNRWAKALERLGELVEPSLVCRIAECLMQECDADLGRLLPIVAELAARCDYRFSASIVHHLTRYEGKSKAAQSARMLRERTEPT